MKIRTLIELIRELQRRLNLMDDRVRTVEAKKDELRVLLEKFIEASDTIRGVPRKGDYCLYSPDTRVDEALGRLVGNLIQGKLRK